MPSSADRNTTPRLNFSIQSQSVRSFVREAERLSAPPARPNAPLCKVRTWSYSVGADSARQTARTLLLRTQLKGNFIDNSFFLTIEF